MKEGQHIDDLFRDRLHDYELEAPMHLWDGVATAVPASAKKKRRGLIWWWVLLLVAVTTILVWALQPFLPGSPSPELDSFPIALTETTANTPEVSATNIPPAQSDEETDQEAYPSVPQTERATGSKDVFLPKRLQTESTVLPLEPEVAKSAVVATSETKVAEENPVQNQLSSFRLDLLSIAPEALDYDAVPDSITFALPEKKGWTTTIDFMASMDFVLRNLEAKDPAFAAYAKRRDETETFRHGTSIGMRLSTVSDNGFAVRSGLNYSTINEQLNLKIGEEERLIAQIKYAEDGSIIGTDTTLAMVGTYRIVNNRYSELDIPLLVGYEYAGRKVSFSFNGGVLINMLSAQRGEFLSPNTDESVSFSSSDPNSYRAFRNRLGLGFYGSMGVYFQVNENLQFLLEPHVKWRPGSYTVDGYVLDQRYFTTGLFVGMRKAVY